MSGLADFDLDRVTAQAWRSFQTRLADHLADMGEEDILVIEVEVARDDDGASGSAPYVQFAGYAVTAEPHDVAMLRGEVSGNSYLAAQFALGEAGIRDLLGLGWLSPTDSRPDADGGAGNFSAELPRSEADRLAVMAVGALRDVFAVAHPAFLEVEGLAPEEGRPREPARTGPPETDWPDEPERAVMPLGPDHLRELVDEALTPLFGETPQHDEDGDIAVPWGSSLVFVHVNDEAPVVELASTVVNGVVDRERAAFEVGVLNRDQRYLTFVLLGDRVAARLNLPACPFVPEHLRFMLTGMSFRLDEVGEDLVARVGGRLALDPEHSELRPSQTSQVPSQERDGREGRDETALLTLLQLDADRAGSVDAELAAGVCGFDQARIVRLLGRTEEQESAWRRARDEALRLGDRAQSRSCEHELEAWQRTTRVLRRALRLVVERSLGRGADAGPGYAPSAEGRSGRPPRRGRRGPDVEGA